MISILISLFFLPAPAFTKEIALSFDDAPVGASLHFESDKRADTLINKLKVLNVQGAMVFANPCKDEKGALSYLKKYVDAGHFVANHTCTHPKLDDVGFDVYSKDTKKADVLLAPLMKGQKFFRFPYLNESNNEALRDRMRAWLKQHQYRQGMVSLDNDDYIVSWALNTAKSQGKKINYKNIETLFLDHILGAVDFYDDLAIKKLGYSPKHVLLLHEVDATILFVDSLVKALRKKGWTIISAKEAYEDQLYLQQPKNTYANNGIIAQVIFEKTGEKHSYNHFDQLKSELIKVLEIE